MKKIKLGFKRKVYWNKYRFGTATQTKNNNLDYLIDPIFKNIDILFPLLFENSNDDPTRNSFNEYNMPLVEIKDFNALIDYKPFFDQPVKNEQKEYEKNIEMSRNYYFTTGKLLDYLYYQNIVNLLL